ncbi:hypothetical protein [Leisingera caerulea]|uniref:Uncharacterized protein n=1 Tax=Leisingera caerulea TaxID=506591 RepID=A0A9Q9LYS3_LEICA|nr:hypothetical protein [Leisingera caerulea]UWQ54441.1 hypothetical protein K3721_02585 [Leisingera caerulea]
MDWLSVDLIKQSMVLAGTVIAAVLAAIFATRRDTRQARIQRHYSFSDERSQQYAEFVRQVNRVWAAWYEFASSWDQDAFLLENKKLRDSLALELDTQMNVLRLTAPKHVVDACGQVNGALQVMTSENLQVERSSVGWRDYESFKKDMIAAMRDDIDLIGRSSDRLSYTKAIRKMG